MGPIFLAVVLLMAWGSIVNALKIPAYIIPSPSDVWSAFIANWQGLGRDLLVTAQEAGAGFLIGAGFGFLCGVLFAHARPLEGLFQPYLVALQAVPIVAIAPLLVIWFGSGILGKIVLAAFITYFPVVVSTAYGVRRVRRESLDLMHILSANAIQIFFKLRLPHSLPFVFSALRVSATLSVIGAIVAEIAGANSGIGHRILIASYRTETATMFAAIACAAFLGLVFYGIVRVTGAYLLRNHEHEFTTL